MIIDTIYNLGQDVFFLLDNKINKGIITQISVSAEMRKGSIEQGTMFKVNYGSKTRLMSDAELSETPEEIAKKLIDAANS